MESYINYNIVDYQDFINLYDFNTGPHQKSNDRRRLQQDFKNKKLTPLVRAFLVYLKVKNNNDNRIDDTPPQTPKPPVEDSDEPDESSDDEEQIVEVIKEVKIKPKLSLLERAIGKLPVFDLHGKAYPDEFNKINDDDLSIDEKNIIASKILNYKIY